MPNLAGTSIKYYVLSIKRRLKSFLHNTYYLIPNTQRGFAPILLIALILIGITAATLLIQTRTNFLPQAADNPGSIKSCTFGEISSGATFSHCDFNNELGIDDATRCTQIFIRNTTTAKPIPDGFALYCKQTPAAAAAPAAGSDYTPGVVGKCDDKQKHYENDPAKPLRCPPQPNSPFTECVVDKLETKSCVEPGKKDGDSCDTTNCLAYEGTKKECKVVGGLPKCRYPTSAKDGACNDADKRTCPADAPYNEECWIYGTDYKYSACRKKAEGAPASSASKPTETTPGKCPSGENGDAYCARETAAHGVESGKGVCYKIDDKARCAYALDYKSPDAANGPCNKKDNDSCIAQGTTCELVEVTLNTTNKPKIKYSQCKAKTGQPAPRPAAGTSTDARTPAVAQPQTAAGSQPRTQAGAPTAAADIICGKDDKGADIPCYAIGVFSPTELTSREAQAKIASVNYTKFRKIIDDEEKRIGTDVANQARKQIAAAEEALKACIK